MKLDIRLLNNCNADGYYKISAKNCIMVSLSWVNENGALNDYTAFAFIPINTSGVGHFRYSGGRAIPPEATGVLGGISDDLQKT